ncbi:MAG: hypothetical protein U1E28_01550 [Beijerinckiaceae bacterium]
MAQATCPEHVSSSAGHAAGLSFGIGRLAARISGALRASEEAALGRAVGLNGGRLTDSMEREMLERALRSDWRSPI